MKAINSFVNNIFTLPLLVVVATIFTALGALFVNLSTGILNIIKAIQSSEE